MADHKKYWVYIVASRTGTLYIGMTNNLYVRVMQHKGGEIEGFQRLQMQSPGVLGKLRRCSQSDQSGKAAEGLAAGEEDCSD